jgi:membrane protein
MMLILAGGVIERFIASTLVSNGAWGHTSVFTQWIVAICCMLLALTVIYRFAPNLSDQGLEAVLPGALVALIGWLAVSSAFRIYLSVFDSFSRTYGSLGAVIVLLLWLYLSAASILIGGEVNSALRRAPTRSNLQG